VKVIKIKSTKKTSEFRSHTVEMHASAIRAFGLVVTLTFDLWPWVPWDLEIHSHVEYLCCVEFHWNTSTK